MQYEKPIMEMILYENEDIITLSSDIGDGDQYGGPWDS